MRTLVTVGAALLVLGFAGCGGDGGGEPPDSEGVRFAVYDAEEQLAERDPEGSLRCGPPRALCPPALINPTGDYRYEPDGEPALEESAVAGATVAGSAEGPVVSVELTTEGGRAFQELTRRLAEAGQEAGRPHHAAVVVGDEIVALAPVDYEQFPDGIETTQLQFYAAGEDDAAAIAARINGQ